MITRREVCPAVRSRATANTGRNLRRLHLAATVAWLALVVPTVLWWKDSILWVGLISCYANAVGHWSAWQASRAETNGTN